MGGQPVCAGRLITDFTDYYVPETVAERWLRSNGVVGELITRSEILVRIFDPNFQCSFRLQ